MRDPKHEMSDREIVEKSFMDVYGIPKEEIEERHIDPFGRGEDVVVYEWHAKDEDEESKE